MQRLINWLFVALFFFLPLLFFRHASEVFELPKMYFVYAMTVLIVGLWIARMIVQKKLLIQKTPLDIPILLFLISQIVSTFSSIDPHTSWFGYYGRFHGGLLSTISYTLLYYAFVSNAVLKGPPLSTQRRSLIHAILASAVLISLYGVLQHFGIDKNLWVQDVVNRVFSTQGQPNWLAAYLVMTIPIAFALLCNNVRNAHSSIRLFVYLSICLFISALLFTRSRSGLIGFAVMDIIFWILIAFKGRSLSAQGPSLSRFFLVHCLLFMLLFAISNPLRDAISQRLFPKLTTHSSQLTTSVIPLLDSDITLRKSAQGGTESGDIRRVVWSGALELVKRYPLVGTGPETFAYTYWWVRPTAHNLTSEWNFLYNKAHNEWLNLAANTGLFGLGSHLLLIGWFFIWILKGQSLQGLSLKYAILSAILGVEAVNFLGFSTVTVGAYTYLYMGLAVATGQQATRTTGYQDSKKQKLSNLVPCQTGTLPTCFFLFITFLVAIFVLSKILILFLADLSYARGRAYLQDRYAYQALKPLEAASNLVPNEPTFRSALAEDEGLLAVSLRATGEQQDLAEKLKNESLQHFEMVAQQSPHSLSFLKTQSRITFSLGVFDAALYDGGIALSKKAQTLAPTNPSIPYAIGVMLQAIEKKDEAKRFYQQALDLKPDYQEAKEKLSVGF